MLLTAIKNCPFEELVEAIRTVAGGKTFVSPSIGDMIIKEYINKPDEEESVFSVLSQREREVLQLVAEGKTTKQAARRLHISPKTVEAHRLPIILTLTAGIVLSLAAVSIPGCRKATPSKPATTSSITSESQEAKEKRIKAEMQELVRNLGEGASYDPQLNLTGPITRMLGEEAEFSKLFSRLVELAEKGRLRFVKVAESDMPLFYKLAQELNAVIKGRVYVNAFTFTNEDEDGLPVYTIIINEKEFQKPPVELWIILIHELLGRVAETEMSGKLGSIEAEEARAYRREAEVLDRVIRCNDSFIQYIQQAASSKEDLQLLRQVLDIETLIEKKNKAEQQAEYYQRQVLKSQIYNLQSSIVHRLSSIVIGQPRVRWWGW